MGVEDDSMLRSRDKWREISKKFEERKRRNLKITLFFGAVGSGLIGIVWDEIARFLLSQLP